MEEKLIYKALAAINAKVGVIGKDRKNEQQGFKFRGIDDVMNELHSLFAEHQVFILPECLDLETTERTNKNGTVLFSVRAKIRFTFTAIDGSNVSAVVVGEGMDSGDKATNKAMSIALKYALLQMFLIPTEEPKDPDAETHEIKAPVQIKETPRATPSNDLPWLTENLYKKAMERIANGEQDVYEKLKSLYRMKTEYRNGLESAVNRPADEPIFIDPESGLPF